MNKLEKLTLENAKDFVLNQFQKLSELYRQWLIGHIEAMIKVIDLLLDIFDKESIVDKSKLYAIAWVHDIGKVEGEENHAEKSIKLLRERFELDEEVEDAILNHGSKGKPKTIYGKIIRYADGLSLFIPKLVWLRFYLEAKEGKDFEKVIEDVKKAYEKYRNAYSDSEEVLDLLERLCKNFLE